MKRNKTNLAFVDGQNLYLGTKEENWIVNLAKFRIYLKDKYAVSEAYYFLGYVNNDNEDLYNEIQKAGFIVVFKEHTSKLLAKKKGNVDTDIVFEIMKILLIIMNLTRLFSCLVMGITKNLLII